MNDEDGEKMRKRREIMIEKTLSKNFNFKKIEREKDKNRKNMHGFVYKWFLKDETGVIEKWRH